LCDSPSGKITYGEVYLQNEKQMSAFNFEHANTDFLLKQFTSFEQQCESLLEKKLCLPAYEMVMKASHTFNLLDARRAISVTERQRYILAIRQLARKTAESYYELRKELNFPLLNITES
jgi:glycyl-tRNA synthetase alpha chain